MNLTSCSGCASVLDKDILLRMLREKNRKIRQETQTRNFTHFLNCPICDSVNEFAFFEEVV